MNATALPPILRRFLALAILAGLVLLVLSAAVWPLAALISDRRDDIEALSEQRSRLDAILAERPGIERRARAAQEQLNAEGGFWTGGSATAIAARIQDRLREAVTGSGGRVTSASQGAETADHGFRKLTVRFTIEGSLDTVEKTFAAIETTAPALFVDAFTIAAPANASSRDGPPPLKLEFEVAGYMQAARE